MRRGNNGLLFRNVHFTPFPMILARFTPSRVFLNCFGRKGASGRSRPDPEYEIRNRIRNTEPFFFPGAGENTPHFERADRSPRTAPAIDQIALRKERDPSPSKRNCHAWGFSSRLGVFSEGKKSSRKGELLHFAQKARPQEVRISDS